MCKKRLDLFSQFQITRAGLVEKRGSLVGFTFERRVEDLFYLPPSLGSHDGSSCFNSRRSHALASFHSLFIVAREIPSVSAVSSRLSPLKKRSSIISLFL